MRIASNSVAKATQKLIFYASETLAGLDAWSRFQEKGPGMEEACHCHGAGSMGCRETRLRECSFDSRHALPLDHSRLWQHSGQITSSFASNWIDKTGADPDMTTRTQMDEIGRNVAAVAFTGGSETVRAPFFFFSISSPTSGVYSHIAVSPRFRPPRHWRL